MTANPMFSLPANAAMAPPAAVAAEVAPAKTWSVGNDLRLQDPRPNGGRIVDAAEMLDATDRRQIAQAISKIERSVDGSQVIVVTVPDVAGKSPKQTATDLFNYWGIGSMQRENGILVLLVRDARRVEIEVGLALEQRFSNSWCTSMLEANVVPLFKEGRYGAGLLEGVEQIGERLRADGGGGYAVQDGGTETSMEDNIQIAGLFAVMGSAYAGLDYMEEQRRRDARRCEKCSEVVDEQCIGKWETTVPATNVNTGSRQRSYACPACENEGYFTEILGKYDSVRYNSDGNAEYYNKPKSTSSSSSRSGGSSSGRSGGGASW